MDTIDINGRTYEVGVDLASGKDYSRIAIVGHIESAEARTVISALKAKEIDVVCIEMSRENMDILSGRTETRVSASPEMVAALNKASMDYPKVICLGHIDEETKVVPPMPPSVKEIPFTAREPLLEPYCPRKNNNEPWYSRWDNKRGKRKKR